MLTIGDTIKTTESDGLEITVRIDKISIDPTWGKDGAVIVYITHSANPDVSEAISFRNLVEWFHEAKWTIIKAE